MQQGRNGLKAIMVGALLVAFGLWVIPAFDQVHRKDLTVTRQCFLFVGAAILAVGLLVSGGVSFSRIQHLDVTAWIPDARGRFAGAPQMIVVLVIVASYLVIAHLAGFYLAVIPSQYRAAWTIRVFECSLLWTLVWTLVGWASHLRSFACRRTLGTRVVVLAPLVLGLAEAVGAYRPTGIGPWMTIPAVAKGFILSGGLWFQARYWIRKAARGHCAECGYDLRGNVTGICPECGLVVRS